MRAAIVMLLAMAVLGCDMNQRSQSGVIVRNLKNEDLRCVDGVRYFNGYRELVPKFNKDTKQVETC